MKKVSEVHAEMINHIKKELNMNEANQDQTLASRQKIANEMVEKIKEAIHTFDDRVTLAEVLGVLEAIKFELIQEAQG